MHNYLIEPKAPLIIRTGRPFDEQAGVDPARFPPPSTLAGALRTAHALSTGQALGLDLAKIAVAGPLPVKLDSEGAPAGLLVPRPADAVYIQPPGRPKRLLRVAPQPPREQEGCDLPDGLLPLQLTPALQGKACGGAPWWSWQHLIDWRAGSDLDYQEVERQGWTPVLDDIRTHVGIERQTQAAETGKLFQTAGLGFWQHPAEGRKFPDTPIGLLGRIDGRIDPGLITLGGERRLSAIQALDAALWPEMPQGLVTAIRAAGGFSLTLLTPGLFKRGWQPPDLPGSALRAAAIERWQPHSGWDLATQQPRAGRKLVPAGSVYWYLLEDPAALTDEDIARLWLSPLGEHQQDCLDGFGLVLPQPWNPPQIKP